MIDDGLIEVELVGGLQDGRTLKFAPPLRSVLIAVEPLPGKPDWNPEWESLVYFDPEYDCFGPVTMNTPKFVVDAANDYHRWAQRMDDKAGPVYRNRGNMRHYDFIGYHTPRRLREQGEWEGFDPQVPY